MTFSQHRAGGFFSDPRLRNPVPQWARTVDRRILSMPKDEYLKWLNQYGRTEGAPEWMIELHNKCYDDIRRRCYGPMQTWALVEATTLRG